MAQQQQIIPPDQLVSTKYQGIGRFGQILVDHALSYALTVTAYVPTVYLQQFWKTFKKAPNANETIHFMLDRKEITYTEFLHCVQQKKDVIQYPQFIKLIIADLVKKFPSIPQRHTEDYHSIKDDIPLVSVYTTGNVTVRGMLLLDEFLTDDIRATEEYKEYENVFVGVDVPTIQPQPVEYTQ
ncbi:hypothetical protein Tco_1171948, partial [Tanacetum coccineum]